MPSPEINIEHIAKLSRLDLTPEEAQSYKAQLSQILEHIDQLSSYPLDAEPSSHAMPVFDVVRQDVARAGLTQEQALSNAPQSAMDQFRILKVVE
jgi:aspartyl-tRNA(Asn)/glutamyl-tRNA(Gln) amidotransferase subunit C